MALKYVGANGDHLTGVPMRDLTDDDLAEVEEREGFGSRELVASGLYEAVPRHWDGTTTVSTEEKPAKPAKPTKEEES